MSDPILEALGAVRSDLAAMRLELMGRIDRMVSREEHRAEIKRLDSLHVQAAKDLADHETLAGDRMAAAERIAHERMTVIERMIESDRESRKADRRYYLTVTLTSMAAISALAQVLRAWLGL